MLTARAALVEEGKVVNMIIVEVNENQHTTFEYPGHEVVVVGPESDAAIGGTYANGVFTPPEVPDPEE